MGCEDSPTEYDTGDNVGEGNSESGFDFGAGFTNPELRNNVSVSSVNALVASTSTDSTNTAVCRICQLSERESDMALEETGCRCKGSIRMCHRQCVQTWIRTQRSSRCELCNTPMAYDMVFDIYNVPSTEQPAAHLALDGRSVCDQNRRSWFFVVFILLAITTCWSVVLMRYTQDDYAAARARAHEFGTTMAPSAERGLQYSLNASASIAIFCGTISVGFALLWTGWEMAVRPREQMLAMHVHDWVNHLRQRRSSSLPHMDVLRREDVDWLEQPDPVITSVV